MTSIPLLISRIEIYNFHIIYSLAYLLVLFIKIIFKVYILNSEYPQMVEGLEYLSR